MTRRYSVEEANEMLPTLTRLLEHLREAHRVMGELHDQLAESATGNGGGGPSAEFHDAASQAAEAQAELDRLGLVVRDPETGLLDFPAERDGRDVFLCWRLGEERVAWWHPLDTGFADRRPL